MSNNVEWLNQNASRSYPFREDATLIDEAGVATLPNELVVDFVFTSPYGADLSLHLKTLLFSSDVLSLAFADADGVTVTALTVILADHEENDGYRVVGQGEYEDATGRITLGDLSELDRRIPPGYYTFNAETAAMEDCTVRPDIRGVRALKILNADGSESLPIYGNVKLVAGINVRLTSVTDELGNPAIRLDALSDDLEEECDCDASVLRPDPIRTINGIAPDGNGNIEILTPGENTNIIGSTGVLTIVDTNSEPCCGCEELEIITSNAQPYQHTVDRMTEMLEQLNSRQSEFSSKVLRSIV